MIGAVVGEQFFRAGNKPGIGIVIESTARRACYPQVCGGLILAAALGIIVFLFFGWLSNAVVGHWYDPRRPLSPVPISDPHGSAVTLQREHPTRRIHAPPTQQVAARPPVVGAVALAACGSDKKESADDDGRRHHGRRREPPTAGRRPDDRRRTGGGVSPRRRLPGRRSAIQTDWNPEAEHGFLYQMIGDGYTVDKDKFAVTGPLIVQRPRHRRQGRRSAPAARRSASRP